MSRRKRLEPEVPPLSPLPTQPGRLTPVWRIVLLLVFVAYMSLGIGHIVSTPVLAPNAGSYINAPDEAAHIGYVRIVGQERRLPVQGDPTYEWHQPPLYYALVAPLFGLGPAALRGATIFIGLLSLVVIFLTARRVFPEGPPLAVLAVGIGALVPMRQAVTSSVGNDALIELFFSLTLYQTVLALTYGLNVKRALGLGFTLGGALLTKATGLLLVPVVLYALYLVARQGEARGFVLKGAVYLFTIAFALIAPWYVRNIKLYGEITPVRAFIHEFENTAKANDFIGQPMQADIWSGALMPGPPMSRLDYLLLLGNWTARSFFAAYTRPAGAAQGIPVFLPPPFYVPFALMTLLGVAGLVRLHFRKSSELNGLQRAVVYVCFLTLFLVAGSFLGFVWTFFQAQGRYLYPALLPLCLLGSLGVKAIIPAARRDIVSLGILALMAVMAVGFLTTSVIPAYAPTPAGDQP
jgi:4-amino-4-deoxy-L-arabinose transferase-like glycosyltransferase